MRISFLMLVGFFLVGANICLAADEAQNMVFEPGTTEFQKTNTEAGIHLLKPFFRKRIPAYVKDCKGGKRRLALGAGHIKDPSKLHPDYQPKGASELRGDYRGEYPFQQYKGWFTASAEVDPNYGSDAVFNINKKGHQEAVFVPNTFDIISDISGHPAIQSGIDYRLLRKSLRPNGVAILPLALTQEEDGTFACGHGVRSDDGENQESSASGFPHDFFQRKIKFKTPKEALRYWSDHLKAFGFKTVTLHASPIFLMYNAYLRKKGLTMKQLEDRCEKNPSLVNELDRMIAEKGPIYAAKTEAAKYDRIFLYETGLGSYYLIAKVPGVLGKTDCDKLCEMLYTLTGMKT